MSRTARRKARPFGAHEVGLMILIRVGVKLVGISARVPEVQP
jgi:hypothetical protein